LSEEETQFFDMCWKKFVVQILSKISIFSCEPGERSRYSGLDGPGIEYRCGRDFPHVSRPALRPTQPPIQ